MQNKNAFVKGKLIMSGPVMYSVLLAYEDGKYNDSDYNKFINTFKITSN